MTPAPPASVTLLFILLNICCQNFAASATSSGRGLESRTGQEPSCDVFGECAHSAIQDIYKNLVIPCEEGSPNGPSKEVLPYLSTKNGRGFFLMVKSTALRPPTIYEYHKYFANYSDFKEGWSLLLVAQKYIQEKFARSIEVDGVNMYGQVVAITGASSGIGLALAIECSKRGATVYGVARRREVFDWGTDIAVSDGQEVYVTSKARGSVEQAAAALRTSLSALKTKYQKLYDNSTSEWLLPQTYYPMYSGQIGVPKEVVSRIIFDEVDVRNASAIDWWLKKIRNNHPQIDFLCLGAQTELGPGRNSSTVEQMLDDWDKYGVSSYDEMIKKWPRRQAGINRMNNVPEIEIGVKYLLGRLVALFGAENVKENTDIMKASSVGAIQQVSFDRGDKKSTGFMNFNVPESSGWSEYHLAKVTGERIKDIMVGGGYKYNTFAPAGFNTMVNMAWVRYYFQNFTGQDIGPTNEISKHPDGRFYYALTASEIHDAYVTMANQGDRQLGGYVGGAAYGALQLLGVYIRDKDKPPLQRRSVFLDNPSIYYSSFLGQTAFGPKPSEIISSSYCYDPTDASQSVGFLGGWKVWNPASKLVDLWYVPSLTYLAEPAPRINIGIIFQINKVPTNVGETVLVIGALAQLGAWDPLYSLTDKALRLRTSKRVHPKWSMEEPLFFNLGVHSRYDGLGSLGTGFDPANPDATGPEASGPHTSAPDASGPDTSAVQAAPKPKRKVPRRFGGPGALDNDTQERTSIKKTETSSSLDTKETSSVVTAPNNDADRQERSNETSESLIFEYKYVIESEVVGPDGNRTRAYRWEKIANRRIEVPRNGGSLWVVSDVGFDTKAPAFLEPFPLDGFDLEAFCESNFRERVLDFEGFA